MEGRKKERKKSLIGFFVRKIRIQTIGLQLEPSKSIRSFPPVYIYIYNGARLFFSSSLAISKRKTTSPFHPSASRARRKYLNRMKRMDKSNYADLPFAAYFAQPFHTSIPSILSIRPARMVGSCSHTYTFFFRPNFTPGEREVTRYIDDIFGGF